MYTVLDKRKNSDELIDSLYDKAFKAIVQNPDFRKSLCEVISYMTTYSVDYLYNNLRFVNTELPVENIKERNKIADIIAKVEGTTINLESNRSLPVSKISKNNLYHHKIAYSQYLQGEKVEDNDIIQINFNAINRFDDRPYISFSLRDEEGKYVDEENFKRIHVNMAKFLEMYYTKGVKGLTNVDKILVMFMIKSKRELREISKGDKELEAMAKIIDDLNASEEMLEAYTYDKDKMEAYMERVDKWEATKKAKEEGFEQGTKQGSKEKELEIAKKMLEKGMDIQVISELTNLSKEEINELKC